MHGFIRYHGDGKEAETTEQSVPLREFTIEAGKFRNYIEARKALGKRNRKIAPQAMLMLEAISYDMATPESRTVVLVSAERDLPVQGRIGAYPQYTFSRKYLVAAAQSRGLEPLSPVAAVSLAAGCPPDFPTTTIFGEKGIIPPQQHERLLDRLTAKGGHATGNREYYFAISRYADELSLGIALTDQITERDGALAFTKTDDFSPDTSAFKASAVEKRAAIVTDLAHADRFAALAKLEELEAAGTIGYSDKDAGNEVRTRIFYLRDIGQSPEDAITKSNIATLTYKPSLEEQKVDLRLPSAHGGTRVEQRLHTPRNDELVNKPVSPEQMVSLSITVREQNN